MTADRTPPDVSVVTGNPTAEELAAVVTVLVWRSRAVGDRPPPPVPTAWNAPARRMRPVVRRGPGAWRRSALPH